MNNHLKPLLLASLLIAQTSLAQNIDFDFINRNDVTEPNYIAWPIGTVPSDSKTLPDGTTLTVTAGGNAQTLRSQWNKQAVTAGLRLMGDGVMALGLDSNNNTPEVTDGPTSITLTIEGMAAGHHSVTAYHHNKDKGAVLPDIQVEVDGTVVLTGVHYSAHSDNFKMADAGMSFVEFNVTEGVPVVITYSTTPLPGASYKTTSITLNALEFDQTPFGILDPKPENHDLHAEAEDGNVTFSWTPAAVAVSHRLALGTDSLAVATATTFQYEGSQPVYTASGLSPLKRYWWRVDEVEADGTVHKGRVMTFQPRRLAFPGAEGYGRFAIGGRGGTVYHVTSLDDSSTPGTLRYGIENVRGPRTIVFDVAGIITLNNRLVISDKFVTVAGQTAPGRGILLRGKAFGMQSDGITRFMRLFLGGGDTWDGASPNPATSDGMGMAGNDHAIMDHCSIAWTIDEGFSSRNAKNITLQRTIISEALNYAGHSHYAEEGQLVRHGYAATIGGGEMGSLCGSYHHNLLAHCEGRNWSLSGGLDGAGFYDGHHDVFNNVVYNWGSRATDGGTHQLNFVNNYYKKGPATTQNFLLRHQFEGVGKGTQSAFVSGNIREELNGTQTEDQLGVTYKYELSNSQVLDWEPWSQQPFFPSYATVQTAREARQDVLSDVGCNMPSLVNHDERIISETLSGTTSTTGYYTKKKGLPDRESDAEGFQGLDITEESRNALWDTDQDGIPNWYEQLAQTDPDVPNNNDDHDGNTYTDLEDYLNWMAAPNFTMTVGENHSFDLKPYFRGYGDFTVVDYDQFRNGFTTTFNGTVLTASALWQGLYPIRITIKDRQTGNTMTRTFHFAALPNTTAVHHLPTAMPAEPIYDTGGRRHPASHKGLNISKGKKWLEK